MSRSSHLVDPELALLTTWPVVEELTPEMLAMSRARPMPVNPEAVPGIVSMERHIPGPAGAPEVRVVIYQPAQRDGTLPAVLHLHGGGYVLGKPEMSDARNRAVTQGAGCLMVSVDYRLAPEHPFPAAIEDCYAALKWLHAEAGTLGIDASRIAVVGESAGGGLAASLCLLARDRGEAAICFQQLIFPTVDDRTAIHEPHPYAGEFVLSHGALRFAWQSLLGSMAPGSPAVSPYAAPARAQSLVGLPPAFISVGALDPLIDEDVEYARRLIRAGIPTELHVYPGAMHGYMAVPTARVTRDSERDMERALHRALWGE
jgi:acetyl esterase/lipase